MHQEPKIRVYGESNAVIIDIQGDLTESADKEMNSTYQKACEYSQDNILLRFHDRVHINSSGLAMVINLLIDSQEKGCKVFASGLTKHYRKIFEISGLSKYITIVESEDEIG